MLVARGQRYPPKRDSEGWVEWWWVRTPPGPTLIMAVRMLLALHQEFPVQKSESDLNSLLIRIFRKSVRKSESE